MHDVFSARCRFATERLGREHTGNHAGFVDHHRAIAARRFSSPSDGANVFGGPAGHHHLRLVTRSGLRGGSALYRKRVGHPIHLARGIVGDGLEPKLLEPPRGPGAQVSSEVVAVDDDRPVPGQLGRGPAVELRQGKVDRPRKMALGVSARREDLDDDGAVFHEPAHVLPSDDGRHGQLPL